MLIVIVLAILLLASALLVLFVALCLAIRREDHSARLASRPTTTGAAFTRRIAGLSVRRSAAQVSAQPDPRLALSGSAPSERNERR
jgi:hypothetical protein